MSRTLSLVQQVQITSPCPAKWDEMVGDDRSRFCSQCKLNVYNLSAMTEAEGEALIIEKEGKLCARIYRRYDGTVLTKDCPVGLRAIRKRMAWVGMRSAAALAMILCSTASAVNAGRPKLPTTSEFAAYAKVMDASRPSAFARTVNAVHRWFATVPPAPPLRVTAGFVGGKMAPSSGVTQPIQQRPLTNSSPSTPHTGSSR